MSETSSSWERSSEPRGGTVPGLWADDDGRAVLAATWAGVHHSSDAGITWQPTAHGPCVPFAEAVVAVGSTYFAAAADGLYRSTDAGESWQRRLVGGRCLGLAARGSLVLVGTERDGVLRSEDLGQTWTGANAGLRDLAVLGLALSPTFESDHLGFAGTTSGLYRTRNGARAWREVELGLPDEPAVQCVAFGRGPDAGRRVLVGTEAHGVLWSDDAGSRWTPADGLAERGVAAIASDADGRLAAATDAGVAVSDDGGQSWRITGASLGPVLSVAFVGHVLLAGLPRDGIARSADHGATWSLYPRGLAASVVLGLVAVPSPTDEVRLVAVGLQDGVLASADGGRTWEPRNAGLSDAAAVGLAASPGGTLCLATSHGVFRSADTACTWRPASSAEQHITALAASRLAPSFVAATAAGGIMRSDDDGQTWQRLDTVPETGPWEVAAVEVGMDGAALVGARTADGWVSVWRRAMHAGRWERLLREPAEGALRLAVCADGEVLVGLGGRLLRPARHAYERRDGERRRVWRATRVGPADALIASIATRPPERGPGAMAAAGRSVFVGTSAGVFVSRDGGESFAAWSHGLRPLGMLALALSPRYARDRQVFGVGLGGTLWRRRDGEAGL